LIIIGSMAEKVKLLLQHPLIYRLFQALLGAEKNKRRLIRENIRPFLGMKILDVGCGPGLLVELLPKGIEYTGVDTDRRYIGFASKNRDDGKRFYCMSFEGLIESELRDFDVAVAVGLLHHLNDAEANRLFEVMRRVLLEGGRVVTMDPCYVHGYGKAAKFVIDRDRGNHVRYPDAYVDLASKWFVEIKTKTESKRINIPYNHFIMECKKIRK
jgi:SAM-dependent methyltransferase